MQIVSTFITQTQPRYRCHDCKLKYKTDPKKRNQHETAMACKVMAEKPRHKYTADFNNKGNPSLHYKNCIGNHYYGQWASLINYFPSYEKGILPFSGGLMEQPSKFVEVMDLVHNLIKENQKEVERQNNLIRQNRSGKRSSKR